VASAVGYNLKLKTTVLSFLPYLFSFGSLPIIILGASNYPIELWYGAVGALFGVGLHLANVFKDLPQDLASGILGLPQVLGEKLCRIGCAICFGTGALILYLQTQSSAAILVGLAAAIFLRPMPAKFAFPYSMALGMAVMLVFITTLA
jgi:4-hydroxybenzoate polyprenyltransferase